MSYATPVSAEELRNFLGAKTYDQLAQKFGGRYIYIRKRTPLFKNPYIKLPLDERNMLIMQDYNNGMKAKEISEKYGLKLRYAHNLLGKLREKEGSANE